MGLVLQEDTEEKFCLWKCFQIIYGHISEAYLGPCETSVIEFFANIVNNVCKKFHRR